MEKKFVVRYTEYYRSGDVVCHFCVVQKFRYVTTFVKFIGELRNNPRYKFNCFITSTTTPDFPFVRWSKKTRLPIGCKSDDLLLGKVWSSDDLKYKLDDLILF